MKRPVEELLPAEAVRAAAEAFPEVMVSADELTVADAVIPHLGRQPNIYQRGGVLVHVVREPFDPKRVRRSPNAPRIVPMQKPRVRELISHAVKFVALRKNKAGDLERVQVRTPQEIVNAVHARGEWPGVRILNGIVECPVLRADGSILQTPGYDAATGLVYEPNVDFPRVPEHPTLTEARAALAMLTDVVCDFPFQSDAHRSAWLALALTPFARPAFDGCSPLGLIDKNVRGAGGTLLCELVGAIYSGRPLARMSQADDTEMRKRITTIAMTGDPIVLIDNVSGVLGGPALEAAITSTVWKDRELGANRDVMLPLRTQWLASANNAAVTGDLVRRILNTRLESMMERPEERGGFKYPDVLSHVYKNRPALVVAALTVLRGFAVARFADQKLQTWGSFEAWSRIIRGALAWAGEADPYAGRKDLVEVGDRDVELLERLLTGWEEFDGPMTTVEALSAVRAAPTKYGVLRDAFADLCDCPLEKVTARKIGNKLARFKHRVVGDRYFDHRAKTGTGVPWVVRVVSDSTDSGDSDPCYPAKSTPNVSSTTGSGKQSHGSHGSHNDDVEREAIQAEGCANAHEKAPPEHPERPTRTAMCEVHL